MSLDPTLPRRARARVRPALGRRRVPRVPLRAVLALAALALLAGGVAAVPSARSAVLRWLGIEGVRIQRVPETPTPAGPRLGLGEPVALPEGALVPEALGEPDETYRDGEILTQLYRPRDDLPEAEVTGAGALFSQFRGSTDPALLQKVAGPDTTVEPVDVGGEPGYWLGGVAHVLFYLDPQGQVRDAPMRLAGPVLVWERGDLTLRLEADVSKARALAIARSVR
jgi:hypothetical protein